MNTPCRPCAGHSAPRFCALFSLCLLLLALGACVKGGAKGGEPTNPNDKKLAYGLTMTVPSGWTVNNVVPPETSKDALDARRKNERNIPLFDMTGAPGARGLQPFITVSLANEEGDFIPRQYAEKLTPDEFSSMAQDILNREKTLAKKGKTQNKLLDMTISRDSIGGNLALLQRLTVVGPDGKPARLLYWDIYLPNSAGLLVRTGCDPEVPNAETEVISITKSMRIQ